MLLVKVVRIDPGQLEPRPVVATADQRVAKQVLALIRESLRREEGGHESMTEFDRRQTDD